jgi:mono/diheme cytochrome c family protein
MMSRWFHPKSRRNVVRTTGTVVIFGLLVLISLGLEHSWAGTSRGANAKLQARGKYLVENIGACADCHTPMNEKGEFIKEKHLQGATLGFKPLFPVPNWADKSANIAGLPGWSDEDAIKFFTTGLAANGLPARPPMPQYRYSQEDAKAVVAYLRSLKPASK